LWSFKGSGKKEYEVWQRVFDVPQQTRIRAVHASRECNLLVVEGKMKKEQRVNRTLKNLEIGGAENE